MIDINQRRPHEAIAHLSVLGMMQFFVVTLTVVGPNAEMPSGACSGTPYPGNVAEHVEDGPNRTWSRASGVASMVMANSTPVAAPAGDTATLAPT
jgi:hypothetical protein